MCKSAVVTGQGSINLAWGHPSVRDLWYPRAELRQPAGWEAGGPAFGLADRRLWVSGQGSQQAPGVGAVGPRWKPGVQSESPGRAPSDSEGLELAPRRLRQPCEGTRTGQVLVDTGVEVWLGCQRRGCCSVPATPAPPPPRESWVWRQTPVLFFFC